MARKKKHDMTPGGLETFDLPGKVIFSCGVHNGDLYEEDDLQAMEEAFYACKGKLRPPLKLGHNEIQSLWEMDGMPAIGWVDNVRMVGRDLVADLIKVPRAIYDLIEAGAYRTMSAEIYWNVVVDGKKYPYALKALALLGADIPAVKTVSDLLSLYKDEYATAYSEDMECEVKTYEGATPDKEKNMPDEKTPEQIEDEKAATEAAEKEAAEKAAAEAAAAENKGEAALTAVVDELKKVVETLSAKKAAHEAHIARLTEELEATKKAYTDLNDKYGKAEADKKYATLEKRVDGLIAGGKIMPAQKTAVLKLLSEIPTGKSYKDGDKEITVEDLVFALFDNKPVQLHTEEESHAGEQRSFSEREQIEKISKDKGIPYKDAMRIWKQQQNPEAR